MLFNTFEAKSGVLVKRQLLWDEQFLQRGAVKHKRHNKRR